MTVSTITKIEWLWGSNKTINFDPTIDKLDFGWFQSGQFTVAETNGSVVVSIPSNQQTYTLNGVKLSQLSLNNIIALDTGASDSWKNTLSSINIATNDSVSGAVSHTETTQNNTVINTPVIDSSSTPAQTSQGTTTTIGWEWGSNKILHFNPSVDKLDFGWFQADQFNIAENNGSVVISIPTNNQTITLSGTTLSQLSMANISALDSGAISEWRGAISNGSAPAPSPSPTTDLSGSASGGTTNSATNPVPSTNDTASTPSSNQTVSYAKAWEIGSVYTGGDYVSVGEQVYQAKWWTQGDQPTTHTGSGGVWSLVGNMSTTPVVPEAPQDLFAASVSDKSTTLIWDAAQIMGVGSIKEYQVFSDGKLVATTADTHLKLSDLSPSTSYNFSVVAVDEAGSSKPSASISLTTKADGTAALDQVFSPYIDMSLSNSQHLVDIVKDAHLTDISLAFVLNSGQNQIGWGGSGSITNDVLPNGSTMLSQIEAVQSMGGNVTISFGGANGVEPALAFTNAKDLTSAYQSVIDRYHVNSIDFDIEGGAIANTNANHLRNVAIAQLEKANPDLKVSFTLPVMPDGLTYNGVDLLKQAKADGVKIDVVNIMAMDYGSGADSGDMGKDAINAAVSTIQQLKAIGMDAKVGIIPMIGINDVKTEVFTLQDAQELMTYAKDNPDIGSIGMWSIGRDNGHEVNVVSPVSSGISQSDYAFSSVFGLL